MITLATDSDCYTDGRTKTRKNAVISIEARVTISDASTIISAYYLPISKADDGSWSISSAALPDAKRGRNGLHVAQLSTKLRVTTDIAERILRRHAQESFLALERYRNSGDGSIPDIIAETVFDDAGNMIDADASDLVDEIDDTEHTMPEITIVDTVSIEAIPVSIRDRQAMASNLAELLRHQYVNAINIHGLAAAGAAVNIKVYIVDIDRHDVGDKPLIDVAGPGVDAKRIKTTILDRLPSKTTMLEMLAMVCDQVVDQSSRQIAA